MKNNGLRSVKEIEPYFMKRMADTLYNMNSKLLVWDEVVNAGLPIDKTIIFWWRHDKPEQLETALTKGYPVVLCPRLPFYFDFVQDSSHNYGRKWDGKYNTLESIYSFSADKQLSGISGRFKRDNVLGLQANLWSETIQTTQRFDYLIFPRIAALSEAAWSAPGLQNFSEFNFRLKSHLTLFQEAGLYYYDPFDPERHPEPVKTTGRLNRFKTED